MKGRWGDGVYVYEEDISSSAPTTGTVVVARWEQGAGDRISLEPALKLGPGPFHSPSDKPLFGAIGDSAPDRWGRVLMRRAERRHAELEKETPWTLREIDFLLRVDDEARLGALRFAERHFAV